MNFTKQKDSNFQNVSELLEQEFRNNNPRNTEPAISLRQWQFFTQYTQFFNPIIRYNSMLSQIFQTFKQKISQQLSIQTILCNQQLVKSLKQHFQQKLLSNDFIIHKQNIYNKTLLQSQPILQIKIINQSQNFEVLEIVCQVSRYQKKYAVFNELKPSFRHQYHSNKQGNMGKIFYCPVNLYKSKSSVAKCIGYSENHLFQLKCHIKQFFLTDMMSALEIGPKLISKKLFDFVIFENCLEFQMEQCRMIKLENIKEDLKINLFIMHLMQIVHSDIKPANIMYSPHFGKNVFIDFGISSVVKQKYGQKSFTLFKGTYQFSSQQMKRIITKKVKVPIDMYKNDVIMLQNSFQPIILRQFYNQFEQSNSYSLKDYLFYPKSHSMKELQGLPQLIIQFKYHLYMNQHLSKINKKFKHFIDRLENVSNNNIYQKIINEGIQFGCNLKSSFALSHCRQIILRHNKSDKQYHQKIYRKSFFNDQYSQNNLSEEQSSQSLFQINQQFPQNQDVVSSQQKQIKLTKMKNRYDLLIKKSQNSNLSNNFSQSNQRHPNPNSLKNLSNIEFVLLNQKEILKFNQQQYLGLWLEYCSFWKNSYVVSINKKILASKIMRSVLEQKQYLIRNSEFFQKKYLPQDSFIIEVCKDLVWVYSYLLAYCLEHDQSQFLTTSIMTILKDTVILGFKYYQFMKQVFQKYVLVLIENQVKDLLSAIFIETFQITFLTQQHFLVISEQIFDYKIKNFRFFIKQIFSQVFLQINKRKIQFQQNYMKKLQIVNKIWMLFQRYQENIQEYPNLDVQRKNYIQSVISQIEDQYCFFQKMSEKESLYRFQKAIKLIYYAFIADDSDLNLSIQFKSRLIKVLNDLTFQNDQIKIINFLQAHNSRNQKRMYNNFVSDIDKKINCQPISFYLLLSLRFQETLLVSKQIDVIRKTIELITSKFNCSSLNFHSFIEIIPDAQMLNYYSFQQYKNILNTILKFDLKLVKFCISQTNQRKSKQRQLKKILMGISNMKVVNLIFSDLEQSKLIQQQLLSLYDKVKIDNLNLIIIYTLLKIVDSVSLQTIKIRKNFFQFCLKKVTSIGVLKNDQGSLKTIHFKNQLNLIFSTQIMRYPYMSKQVSKYWKLKKMKLQFIPNQHIFAQFPNLLFCFLTQLDYQSIYEVIIQFCYEKHLNNDIYSFKVFHYCLQKLRTFKFNRYKFVEELLILLNKLTDRNLQNLYFIDLYLHLLYFTQYFSVNIKEQKHLLYVLCNTLSKRNILKQSLNIFNKQRQEQIYFYSIKHLQKLPQKQRKINILIRSLVKHIMGKSQFYRGPITSYLKKYFNIFFLSSTKQRYQYLKYEKSRSRNEQISQLLHKKRLRLIGNSLQCQMMDQQKRKWFGTSFGSFKNVSQADKIFFPKQMPDSNNSYQIQNSQIIRIYKKWLQKKYNFKDTFLFESKVMFQKFKQYFYSVKQEQRQEEFNMQMMKQQFKIQRNQGKQVKKDENEQFEKYQLKKQAQFEINENISTNKAQIQAQIQVIFDTNINKLLAYENKDKNKNKLQKKMGTQKLNAQKYSILQKNKFLLQLQHLIQTMMQIQDFKLCQQTVQYIDQILNYQQKLLFEIRLNYLNQQNKKQQNQKRQNTKLKAQDQNLYFPSNTNHNNNFITNQFPIYQSYQKSQVEQKLLNQNKRNKNFQFNHIRYFNRWLYSSQYKR